MKSHVAFFLFAVLILVQFSHGLQGKFQEPEIENEVPKPAKGRGVLLSTMSNCITSKFPKMKGYVAFFLFVVLIVQVSQGLSLEAYFQGMDGLDTSITGARVQGGTCVEWKCNSNCLNTGFRSGYCTMFNHCMQFSHGLQGKFQEPEIENEVPKPVEVQFSYGLPAKADLQEPKIALSEGARDRLLKMRFQNQIKKMKPLVTFFLFVVLVLVQVSLGLPPKFDVQGAKIENEFSDSAKDVNACSWSECNSYCQAIGFITGYCLYDSCYCEYPKPIVYKI
ncbi:hypothetical protein NQ315_010700 [Exocentrus adspersus]|uniref:Uncharacterized protein n=1 Tax=Exocentrus adspersus TaxID=1586481 RepID=A0AAV8VUF4_9CUCU|nr:hypothetical protein NQ315_010700 [Exocentrus adspersus]